VEWVVLAVSPTSAERRTKDRRVRDVGPGSGKPDRRKGKDRRGGGDDTARRVKIDPDLVRGWLAFEGAGERRRLSPVPTGWLEASDAELRDLLARAKVVFNPRGRLVD
jgi:hypothetical protein